MLQGESRVSRGNIIYALCHVSLNVRLKVKKKHTYCELGPPVIKIKEFKTLGYFTLSKQFLTAGSTLDPLNEALS